jgi:hypothetical protein
MGTVPTLGTVPISHFGMADGSRHFFRAWGLTGSRIPLRDLTCGCGDFTPRPASGASQSFQDCMGRRRRRSAPFLFVVLGPGAHLGAPRGAPPSTPVKFIQLRRVEGETSIEDFGISIATMPDLDGDGLDGLAIGATTDSTSRSSPESEPRLSTSPRGARLYGVPRVVNTTPRGDPSS